MRNVVLHVLIGSLFLAVAWMDAPAPPPVAPVVEPPPAPVHYTLESQPPPVAAVAEVRSPGNWGETIDRGAFGNRTKITLREAPASNAAVVTLREFDALGASFEVLDSFGSWLRVRRAEAGPQTDGWVEWNTVVPDTAALVLDTTTGAVVARLPLAREMTGISFAPDGSRAVIGSRYEGTHSRRGTEASVIYEVRTSDFTLTRMIRLPADAPDMAFAGAFYDREDGTLRVLLLEGMADVRTGGSLEMATVDGTGRLIDPIVVESEVSAVAIAPNEQTAVVLYAGEYTAPQHRFGVVDLRRATIRNTVTVADDGDWWLPFDIVLNADGSELFGNVSGTVVAIDTRTGKVARSVAIPARDSTSLYASTQNVVNSSLLVPAYDYDSSSETSKRVPGFWVRGSSVARADRRIELVCEIPGGALGVDAAGTTMFRLDTAGRIVGSRSIPRGELWKGSPAVGYLMSRRLAAYPDGSRVVLFLQVEDGC